MKKLLILLLFLSLIGYSQDYKIPEFNLNKEFESKNVYIDLLNIKDKEALIIKVSFSKYSSDFIVYQNNGKIYRFNSTSLSYNSSIKIKREKVKKNERTKYWKYLIDLYHSDKLNIIKDSLNISEIYNQKDKTITSMIISHGSYLAFQIIQENKYIAYGSYSPKAYIRSKFPGYKERQKLVNLIEEIEILLKNDY